MGCNLWAVDAEWARQRAANLGTHGMTRHGNPEDPEDGNVMTGGWAGVVPFPVLGPRLRLTELVGSRAASLQHCQPPSTCARRP